MDYIGVHNIQLFYQYEYVFQIKKCWLLLNNKEHIAGTNLRMVNYLLL